MAPAAPYGKASMLPLYVSMTSISTRIPSLDRVVDSLVSQSLKPSKIILNISEGPAGIDQGVRKSELPESIQRLASSGTLEINEVENTGSYRKLLPVLAMNQGTECLIATADDDVLYPSAWLEGLVRAYDQHQCVAAYRCRRMVFRNNGIAPYLNWPFMNNTSEDHAQSQHPEMHVIATGRGGILYNSRFFSNSDLLHQLRMVAPHQDDIVFRLATLSEDVPVAAVHYLESGSDRPEFAGIHYPENLYFRNSAPQGRTNANDKAIVDGLEVLQRNGLAGDFIRKCSPASSVDKSAVQSKLAEAVLDKEKPTTFKSSSYWENRYLHGGTSGAGSYGRLAEFKADVINGFVGSNKIQSVIEFGCGDGAQTDLFRIPNYIGVDVSQRIVKACLKRFAGVDGRRFIHTSELVEADRAELGISLDVIYHLIEDDVFADYMRTLFDRSTRNVIIYSSNMDRKWNAEHVRHRIFTKFVEDHHPDWTLVNVVPNKYPFDIGRPNETSFADFHFYARKGETCVVVPPSE